MSLAGPALAYAPARVDGETVWGARGEGAGHNDGLYLASPPRERGKLSLRRRLLLVRNLDEHVVDEAELLGFRGGEVTVAFRLRLDDFERFTGMPREDFVQAFLLFQDLAHL